MLFKNKLYLIILGIILGILTFLGPSIILSILVLSSIFFFVATRPSQERNIFIKIIIIGFILRIICFGIIVSVLYGSNIDISRYPIIFKVFGHTGEIVRDFDREIKNGRQIYRYLRGEFGNIPIKEISIHGAGFLHRGAWIQGILNFIFGLSVFNILLFPILDLWSIIVIYYLAKRLANERVASFASFLYAVTPSSIVLACSNMRTSLGVLSMLLIGLSLVMFSKINNPKYLFLLAINFVLFMIMKPKIASPILVFIPLVLFFCLNIKRPIKVILLILFFIFILGSLYKSSYLQTKVKLKLRDILAIQIGYSVESSTSSSHGGYKIYDDYVYTSLNIEQSQIITLLRILIKGLPKGILYFIFSPFPWKVIHTSHLYFYPQTLFWYFIIPFSLIGIIRCWRLKAKEVTPIVLYCGFYIILLSLVLGNEGIGIRHRELIAPFFYIFAGFILCSFIPFYPKDYYKIV